MVMMITTFSFALCFRFDFSFGYNLTGFFSLNNRLFNFHFHSYFRFCWFFRIFICFISQECGLLSFLKLKKSLCFLLLNFFKISLDLFILTLQGIILVFKRLFALLMFRLIWILHCFLNLTWCGNNYLLNLMLNPSVAICLLISLISRFDQDRILISIGLILLSKLLLLVELL